MLPARYWSDWISDIRAGALSECQASAGQQNDIVALLNGFATLQDRHGSTLLQNIVTILRAATSFSGAKTSINSVMERIHTALELHARAYEVSRTS